MQVPGHFFSVHSQVPCWQVLDVSEMVENTVNSVIKHNMLANMLVFVHHTEHRKKNKVIPGVALVRDLCSRGIKMPIMLTWTFIFFHTRTFAIIKEASWTLTARFTLCGVLGRWKGHSHYWRNWWNYRKYTECVVIYSSPLQEVNIRLAHTIIIVLIQTSSGTLQSKLSCARTGTVEVHFWKRACWNWSKTYLIYIAPTKCLWWDRETIKKQTN